MNQLESTDTQAEMSLAEILLILRRRRKVIWISIITCLSIAVILSIVIPPIWVSDAQLVLLQKAVSGVARQPQDPSDIGYENSPVIDTIDTEMGMIQSDAMYDRTMDYLRSDPVARSQAGYLLTLSQNKFASLVTVTNPRLSNLLIVSVQADTPQRAALFANSVVQAFVNWKDELARKDLEKYLLNLKVQLPEAQARMSLAKQKLAAYQKSHRILDPANQTIALIQEMSARDADVAQASEDVRSQQARLAGLEAQLQHANSAIKNVAGFRNDLLLQSLQSQLYTLETQRAAAAQLYTKAYPGQLGPLDAQIADLEAKIKKAIPATFGPSLTDQDTLYQDYLQEVDQTSFSNAHLVQALQAREALKAEMDAMPQSSMVETQLQQDAIIAETTYNDLQAAISAARLNLDKVTSDVLITEGAIIPEQQWMPNWIIDIALGLLLGIFTAIIIVFVQEQLDRKVHGPQDVKRLISRPIIGVLPHLRKRQIRAVSTGHTLPQLQEPLNVSRINLQLIMHRVFKLSGSIQQTILVTSAVPREGKSFVAAQIARSMAASGRTVVMVDANLRSPVQHIYFNAAPRSGLAEVLTEQAMLSDVIAKTGYEGLSLLHAGAFAGNPADLLGQPNLADMVTALRQRADIVIIDGQGCSNVIDPLFLAVQADLLLQVVGIDRVPEVDMVNTAAALEATGKTMAMIINNAPKTAKNAGGSETVTNAIAALNGTTTIAMISDEARNGDNKGRLDLDEGLVIAIAPKTDVK